MRKRAKKMLYALAILVIANTSLQAQQMQLLLDPINPYQKSSLFNLSLINSSNYSGQVSLKAKLKSRRGKLLMTQEINTTVSANGTISLRGTNAAVSTSFIDAEFNRLYTASQQLPPMNFVLCIEAYAIGDLSSKVQECIDYDAADFINVSAVYPQDEEILYNQRPTFNWLDVDINNNYCYDFSLVKVEAGQNINVALRRNAPIVIIQNVCKNQVQFPSDAPPLEDNQEYAWQLTINYNGEKVSKSDASSFTYKENIEYIDIPRNLAYVDITEIQSGATLYAVGEFKFKFPSDKKNELTAELYQQKKKSKKQLDLNENSFTVEAGVNKFELDLKDQAYLKHLKKYELILKDKENNRSYQFFITYVNPDYIK